MREIHHTLARFTVARLKRFQNSIGTTLPAPKLLRFFAFHVKFKLSYSSVLVRYVMLLW